MHSNTTISMETTPGDVFITFVYAAVVHLTLIALLDGMNHLAFLSVAVAILLLLFLGFDWMSRVRVRRQLPESFSAFWSYAKTFFELLGVFFLAITLVAISKALRDLGGGPGELMHLLNQARDSSRLTPFAAFAFFAFLVFFWDLVVLKTMEELSWRELVKALWRGGVLELSGVKYYAADFLKWKNAAITKLEQEAAVLRSSSIQTINSRNIGPHTARWILLWSRWKITEGRARCIESALCVFGELMALHITLSNLVVGVFIGLSEYFLQGDSLMSLLGPGYFWWVAALLASWMLFLCKQNGFAAKTFVISIGVGYLSMSSFSLVTTLALQQTIANVFLQFVIRREKDTPAKTQPVNGVTTVSQT